MENTACCSCSPVVETRFSGNRGRSPSYAIIEAVAAADGIAPIELDSIYNDIDPEALDTLLEDQNNESVCIRITINGWNVFLRADGALRVCDPTLKSDPAPVFEKALAD